MLQVILMVIGIMMEIVDTSFKGAFFGSTYIIFRLHVILSLL